jgi:hypothetical protein
MSHFIKEHRDSSMDDAFKLQLTLLAAAFAQLDAQLGRSDNDEVVSTFQFDQVRLDRERRRIVSYIIQFVTSYGHDPLGFA